MSKGIDYSKWDNIDVSSSEDDEEDEEYDGVEDNTEISEVGKKLRAEKAVHDSELMFRAWYPHLSQTADGWFQSPGGVMVHPEDQGKAYYPQTVLREDPNTFCPDRASYEDGRVTKWGIQDPLCKDDVQMTFSTHQMHQLAGMNNLYGNHGNPTEQFIKILEKRKLAEIDARDETLDSGSMILKISLCLSEQDCWRRVRVPSSIDLAVLHDQVIVPVMGWSRGYHAYIFEDPRDGSVIGPKKHSAAYIDMMWAPIHHYYVMDDHRIPLSALLQKEGDHVFYTYDLGDNWEHRIVLEQKVTPDDDGSGSILLLDGAGACPPEDSNGLDNKGTHGYAEFLKAFKKNPRKPKVKQAVQAVERSAINYFKPWGGGPPIKFKPLEFNIEHHRFLMEMMIAGPSVKKKGNIAFNQHFKETFRGCDACGDRIKALLKCSKCRKASYCSRDCQVDDWKNGGHKLECKRLTAGKNKN